MSKIGDEALGIVMSDAELDAVRGGLTVIQYPDHRVSETVTFEQKKEPSPLPGIIPLWLRELLRLHA